MQYSDPETRKRFDEAVERVYKKLSAIDDDEFYTMLKENENGPIAQIIKRILSTNTQE